MAHVIALTTLAALGLSRASFHETFHADGPELGHELALSQMVAR